MTTIMRDMSRVIKGLEDQGATVRKSKQGYRVYFPDGGSTTMSPTTEPHAIQNQRATVRRHGLRWPLDPEPKVRKSPATKTESPAPVETETTMAAPRKTASPNMEIIEITPELAEEWLELNTSNRKLSDLVVAKYVKLMIDGLWHYDGSPIRFDTSGKLIDGQHRLWAIIESGTTQSMVVMRNLDPKAFITIDTGKGRSFGDVLSIEYPSMKSVHNVAAITALIWRWEQGYRGKNLRPTGNIPTAPPEVLLEFFRPLHDEIVPIQRAASNVGQRLRGVGTSALSLMMWVFGQLDAEDADYFFDRLGDGAGLEAGDPILAYRNYVLRFINNSANVRVALPTELSLALGIKAWNAYRKGNSINQLSFRVGGAKPEPFPIPE